MKREDIRDLLVTPAIVVALTLILYRCIQNWLSINDNYEAATLTSSLLMAIVTAIYVRYTYRIFDATNKNTEQTANAQKIAYCELRLEKFYLPIENALQKVCLESIEKLNKQVVENKNSPHELYD